MDGRFQNKGRSADDPLNFFQPPAGQQPKESEKLNEKIKSYRFLAPGANKKSVHLPYT